MKGGEEVDPSALLPHAIIAAKMKPIKAPIKRPIVKGIIGSSFLNSVAWTQADFGFCVIYMDNILEGYGQNLLQITCNANAILKKEKCVAMGGYYIELIQFLKRD